MIVYTYIIARRYTAHINSISLRLIPHTEYKRIYTYFIYNIQNFHENPHTLHGSKNVPSFHLSHVAVGVGSGATPNTRKFLSFPGCKSRQNLYPYTPRNCKVSYQHHHLIYAHASFLPSTLFLYILSLSLVIRIINSHSRETRKFILSSIRAYRQLKYIRGKI